MSVTDRLASSLGRRDDTPNKELAVELTQTRNADDVRELVANLDGKDRSVQSDSIKVLYELGDSAPDLIAEYAETFLALLKSRNNRLVWGAMSALATIAGLRAPLLYEHRDEIERAIDTGSVITADRGIKALSAVATEDVAYRADIFPYLMRHLATCRPKDVPQRAEAVLGAVDAENKTAFIDLLEERSTDMSSSQLKRVRKVMATAKER